MASLNRKQKSENNKDLLRIKCKRYVVRRRFLIRLLKEMVLSPALQR
jgi:hypothetical protein